MPDVRFLQKIITKTKYFFLFLLFEGGLWKGPIEEQHLRASAITFGNSVSILTFILGILKVMGAQIHWKWNLKSVDFGETDIQGVWKIWLTMKWLVFKPKNLTNESSNNQYTKLSSLETLFLFQKRPFRLRNCSWSNPVTKSKITMKLSTYLTMRGSEIWHIFVLNNPRTNGHVVRFSSLIL